PIPGTRGPGTTSSGSRTDSRGIRTATAGSTSGGPTSIGACSCPCRGSGRAAATCCVRRAAGLPAASMLRGRSRRPAGTPGWRGRLAVELAAYLADTLAQALRGEAGLELPALTPVAEALAARDTLGWEAAFLRAARHGRLPWSARVEQWPEVEAALSDLLDRIVLAQEDPEIAVHDAARQLDGLLSPAPWRPGPAGAPQRRPR